MTVSVLPLTSQVKAQGLALTAVANFADDFDETSDEEVSGPILPREDRLWRHPSEIHKDNPVSLDPIAVRRKWLQTQPTRASAWTAGLVGALLATGLVVLGTHLASALTGNSSLATSALNSVPITSIAAESDITPALADFGSSVTRAVSHTSKAMAHITVTVDGQHENEYGLVVNSAGYLVIPFSQGGDTSSILVTLDTGVQYVGTVAGADAGVGVDLVHINGASNLPVAVFASGNPIQAGSLIVAITSSQGATAIGTVRDFKKPPVLNSLTMNNTLTTDLNTASTPLGAVMLNGLGRISGFVIGDDSGRLVVAQGSLLGSAVESLISSQMLSTRTLGISCETASGSPTLPEGAQIQSIVEGFAGANAGLAKGEIIVGVNGMTVTSKATFERALEQASPRSPLLLTVFARSSPRTVIIPATVATTP
ncbi:MAG TPA: S1C family serine protease [Acidimicrobiales bacterium]|nr:S1C family serine protease [Acidimicrobiales bacterium]